MLKDVDRRSKLPRGRIRLRKEQAILRAAEKVFARSGFEGSRMAEIAQLARTPKPTLHYYFQNKESLYRAVLDEILELWMAETDVIVADADPATAIENYVRAKMRLTQERPDASRVFANELLHGAPELQGYLRTTLHDRVAQRAQVLDRWQQEGKMLRIDSTHLFFSIWAMTQTYADFQVQICAVLGKSDLDQRDFATATDHVVAITLRACGLQPLSAASADP